MTSEVEKAVSAYRAEVDRGERETLLDLARLWGKSRGAMQEWIDALIRRINEDGGEWDGYLNSLYRFEMMREQARKIIDGYMADVFRVVEKKIRTNVTLGLGNAKKLIEIMPGNDPRMNLKTGIAMDAEEIIAALTREGSPFDRLMRKDYSDEVVDAIRDTLTRGVAMGSGWEQVAREMTEASDMIFDRAKRIARTEMNRALRRSTLEGYRASGVVKAYRRMCYKETACFACLMMDGELYDLEMDFSDHPNGKCTIIPVLDKNEKPDWETGREWFEKLDPEEQKRLMGKTRFDLWQEGQIGDLRDLVELKPNDIWGPSPQMIPLSSLELSGISKSQKPALEMYHRKIGERGKEICPKAIRDKLLQPFLKNKGILITGEDARQRCEKYGASAIYSASGNYMVLRDDATITEVLEETYHYKQDMRHDFGIIITPTVLIKREIEAQKYLIKNADRYKIPEGERQETMRYLEWLLEEGKRNEGL